MNANTKEIDLQIETDEGGAFYLGFFGRAEYVQPDLSSVSESLVRRVGDTRNFEESRDIGRLLGDAYIQSEENRGRVEISARRFQHLVRRLDREVLKRSLVLQTICERRGRRGEPIIAILNEVLMNLDYPRDSSNSLEGWVYSCLGKSELKENIQSFIIRNEYCGALCAMLDGRVVRVPPQHRTKPMSRREAGSMLQTDLSRKKAGEWFGNCLVDGEYAYERCGNKIVLDVRIFPPKFHHRIRP